MNRETLNRIEEAAHIEGRLAALIRERDEANRRIKMKEYLVTWKLNIDAESPRQAAEKALEIQRDPDSTATFFKVESMEPGGGVTHIALSQPVCTLCGESAMTDRQTLCDRCWELETRIGKDPEIARRILVGIEALEGGKT